MKKPVFLMMAILIGASSSSVNADIMIKSRTTMDQMLGIGSSKSETSIYIKGDRSRMQTTTSFNSPFFKLDNQDMTSEKTEICRLDKEVRWDLEPRDGSYREIFLRSLKSGKTDLKGKNSGLGGDTSESEVDNYIWTASADISDKGEIINGFKSRSVLITAVGVNKEEASDSLFVTFKVWKCEEFPNLREMEEYQKRFFGIAGFEEDLGLAKMEEYSSGFGAEFAEKAGEIEEMKGLPIKTEMSVFKSSSEESGGYEPGMSGLMKGLTNPEKQEKQDSETGRIIILSISNEITEADTSAISGDMFEIPEGYTKKE